MVRPGKRRMRAPSRALSSHEKALVMAAQATETSTPTLEAAPASAGPALEDIASQVPHFSETLVATDLAPEMAERVFTTKPLGFSVIKVAQVR